MTLTPASPRSCSTATILRSAAFAVAAALSTATIFLLAGCGDSRSRIGTNPGAPDAGGSTPSGAPPLHAPLTSASKVDMLFLIDDSASMAPWQAKLRERLPNFMNVLKNAPGGQPDVHVAVVSSSLGAGIFANISGCAPDSLGNLGGVFQHKEGCGLQPGETFIRSTGGDVPSNNFSGDISDVFSCIADLGERGCGFEHQLEATRVALQRATEPSSENHGFLRPDALLSVVMLTNEDDCSLPADSTLLDPSEQTTSDPLGGLQSYRCNEFGHRCAQALPHSGPASPQELTGCHSAEDGKLIKVSGFIDFLYSLKPGRPDNVFVAVIAGPTTPYVVESRALPLGNGAQEVQPTVAHSCTGNSETGPQTYADPAIRLAEVTAAFSPNSAFTSICADDFTRTMTGIALQMVGQP